MLFLSSLKITGMIEFWNERYRETEYAYGEAPNQFFKVELGKLIPGTILLPADGEGRNSVYAATKGWLVDSFDSSTEGKKKALQLAEKHNVDINYTISSAEEFEAVKKYDCIALVFAHFPKEIRRKFLKKVPELLKDGGVLIVEAYNIEQIKNDTGGPKNEDMVYALAEMEELFSSFYIETATNEITEIQEGKYHNGISSVVRFVAKK